MQRVQWVSVCDWHKTLFYMFNARLPHRRSRDFLSKHRYPGTVIAQPFTSRAQQAAARLRILNNLICRRADAVTARHQHWSYTVYIAQLFISLIIMTLSSLHR